MCVCVLGTQVSCPKTAEPIEMPFGELTHVGLMNHALDGGRHRTNPFTAALGDKTAMRLFAKLLWTHVIITIIIFFPPK